jgi:cytochrome oxidase Cu insertion factor (SCO1/SenC/PrrC family)
MRTLTNVSAPLFLAILLAMVVPGSLTGGQTPQPQLQDIDEDTLGPQVGQQVPDFRLTDQNGKVWARDSIMGPKGAMLVFFRSADW